jgi:branched-chain amino acid transport system substrate-binding protein
VFYTRAVGRGPRAWIGTSLLLLVLGGCSLTAIDARECENNVECRGVFGLGSTCSAGFCSAPRRHPRCSRTFPGDLFDNQAAYADYIVFGSLNDYNDHLDTLLGTELAIRQVNNNAGLEGTRYGIVHCDYAPMAGDALDDVMATEETAVYLAQELGVPAIVGPRGSSRTEAGYNAIAGSGVVLISASATSPALTPLDGSDPSDAMPGFLWRTAPPDSLQSYVIAADMRERNVENVAVIHQTGAYGDGLKSLFVERFGEQGGGNVDEYPFTEGFAEAVADVADGLAAGDYDEVMFVSSDIEDYIAFFASATATDSLEAAFSAEGVGIFLADAAFSAQLLEATVADSEVLFAKVRGTRPAPAEGALFNAFAAAYAAEFSADATSSAYTPHAYDAAWLVIYGSAWSRFNEGEVTGLGIARGLRRVSSGTAIEIQPTSWSTVVDAFRMGQSVNVEGASGPLDYDPQTEETAAPISLWVIVADPDTVSGYDFEEIDRTQPG